MKYFLKDGLKQPTRAYPSDAGLDLRANIDINILPNAREYVPTGIFTEIPENHMGMVVPRSGLSTKSGLMLANSIGVIDSNYRGEIVVCMYNSSANSVTIKKNDRIAQLIVVPVFIPVVVNVDKLDKLSKTDRKDKGFGSSGND